MAEQAKGSSFMGDLTKTLEEFAKNPTLQVIAVYDCARTKEEIVRLNFGIGPNEIIRAFGFEAGPVLRWLDTKPFNRYGFAFVLSEANLRLLLRQAKREGVMETRVTHLSKEV